jgi:hypothetical protein
MAFAIWTYLRGETGEFLHIPSARYTAFHAGRAPLTGDAVGVARVIELMIELENRVPIRLRNWWFRVHSLGPDGYRDPKASSLEAGLYACLESQRPNGPASAGSRLAERELNATFRWSPTESDLTALAWAVNRRAKRHLLRAPALTLVD